MLTRLRNFLQHSITSLQQYPGAYLVAIAIAVVAMRLNHHSFNRSMDDLQPLQRVLFGLVFLLPLMVVGPMMREISPSYSR